MKEHPSLGNPWHHCQEVTVLASVRSGEQRLSFPFASGTTWEQMAAHIAKALLESQLVFRDVEVHSYNEKATGLMTELVKKAVRQ